MARLPNGPRNATTAGGKRTARGLEEHPAEPYLPEEMAEDSDPAAPLDGTLGEGLARGVTVIADTVRTLSASPGVYRMLNRRGDALYVGKARNLKRRVTSYTQIGKLPRRLQRMVAETVAMEVVETHTEVEALLPASNLIKRLTTSYKVLMRDDKSFPYILQVVRTSCRER